MNLMWRFLLICLIRATEPALPRVSLGDTVDPKDYPYLVAVRMKAAWNNWITATCTGSLISRSVVLTAGHCTGEYEDMLFDQVDFMRRVALSPVVYRTVPTTGTYFSRVDPSEYHGAHRSGHLCGSKVNDEIIYAMNNANYALTAFFNVPETEGSLNRTPLKGGELGFADLALFSLKYPVPLCNRGGRDDDFSIIKLPIVDVHSRNWTYEQGNITNCTMLGFGTHDKGRSDGLLRKLEVSLKDHGTMLYAPLLPNERKGRACSGDSGGPTVCQVDNKGFRLIGLTSFSFSPLWGASRQCFGDETTMTYDVYVDIRKVLSLIHEGLAKLGKLDEFIEDFEGCAMSD
ncbi:hypothetical protein Tcan_08019 [Toxocara canis]|uniref:Peptidase S1 domain-containing protein n=1 Tax=Toxocara canis TaxID=6265 RepID=A0A0B2V357_TOXCA|nr:hypothetical protein Tcan_08019 [Toxocara canis]